MCTAAVFTRRMEDTCGMAPLAHKAGVVRAHCGRWEGRGASLHRHRDRLDPTEFLWTRRRRAASWLAIGRPLQLAAALSHRSGGRLLGWGGGGGNAVVRSRDCFGPCSRSLRDASVGRRARQRLQCRSSCGRSRWRCELDWLRLQTLFSCVAGDGDVGSQWRWYPRRPCRHGQRSEHWLRH